MAIRKIREEGDALLLKKSRPVTDFNDRLHILLDDMRETLLEADGVGLAAPQVGVLRRAVIVMDTSLEDKEPEEQIIELINPEIIESDGEQRGPEGCLSVPGVYGLVERPNHVKVRAQDRFGNWFEAEGTGLTARCFCHEIDHLDGHLFTERSEKILSDEELEEYYGRKDED
ncbi:MAG: peptide deformylase [Oscillospiraceae bacterium]|nr:peptide deformylase [Oscillospiraceae bacterium]